MMPFFSRSYHSFMRSSRCSSLILAKSIQVCCGDTSANYVRGFSSRVRTVAAVARTATDQQVYSTPRINGDKTAVSSWRFRERGPIGNDEEIRVLLAGPHFRAALPSLRAEFDRRRNSDDPRGLDAGPDTPYRVRLVHAPTTEALWREARTAHVAIPFMEAFPEDFLAATPDLRLVVQFGVGLEGVAIDAATSHGIAVTNMPAAGTGNAKATAEHALYLGVSLLRSFPTTDYQLQFPNRCLAGLPVPRTIYGKRATVVGYGAVGSCLANYLSVLGARVTVVRSRPWEREERDDQESVFPVIHRADSLDEALPTTDILFLACTLTPQTLSLLDETTIGLLPEGALVVNVGRGPLVEHGAMLAALRSGRIGGFASDVGIGHPTKPSEPWDPDDEICRLPNANVLFTPHVGGYADVPCSAMVRKIADAIERVVVRGEAPSVWVNRPNGRSERESPIGTGDAGSARRLFGEHGSTGNDKENPRVCAGALPTLQDPNNISIHDDHEDTGSTGILQM